MRYINRRKLLVRVGGALSICAISFVGGVFFAVTDAYNYSMDAMRDNNFRTHSLLYKRASKLLDLADKNEYEQFLSRLEKDRLMYARFILEECSVLKNCDLKNRDFSDKEIEDIHQLASDPRVAQ